MPIELFGFTIGKTQKDSLVLNKNLDFVIDGVSKGAYSILDCDNPELIFIATGSEVSLALEVAEKMSDKKIRVISMPCREIFEQQSDDYKNSIIPNRGAMKISMEAGITMGWEKYIGVNGLSIGIDHYGASAPGKDLSEEFGFTSEKVENKIRDHLSKLL